MYFSRSLTLSTLLVLLNHTIPPAATFEIPDGFPGIPWKDLLRPTKTKTVSTSSTNLSVNPPSTTHVNPDDGTPSRSLLKSGTKTIISTKTLVVTIPNSSTVRITVTPTPTPTFGSGPESSVNPDSSTSSQSLLKSGTKTIISTKTIVVTIPNSSTKTVRITMTPTPTPTFELGPDADYSTSSQSLLKSGTKTIISTKTLVVTIPGSSTKTVRITVTPTPQTTFETHLESQQTTEQTPTTLTTSYIRGPSVIDPEDVETETETETGPETMSPTSTSISTWSKGKHCPFPWPKERCSPPKTTKAF